MKKEYWLNKDIEISKALKKKPDKLEKTHLREHKKIVKIRLNNHKNIIMHGEQTKEKYHF